MRGRRTRKGRRKGEGLRKGLRVQDRRKSQVEEKAGRAEWEEDV